jgi:hypothetical protein
MLTQLTLFGATPPSTNPLVGLTVRLDRPSDRIAPCHENIATIGSSRGPHHHALTCVQCNSHRGWLGAQDAAQLADIITKFGVPASPLVIRPHTPIGDEPMSDYQQRDFSGVLFRNDEKRGDNSPDYTGSVTVHGEQFRLGAWVKTAKNGSKFMSLALTAKDAAKPTSKPTPARDKFDDALPF